jgi:hypothetical protein
MILAGNARVKLRRRLPKHPRETGGAHTPVICVIRVPKMKKISHDGGLEASRWPLTAFLPRDGINR